VPEQLKRDFMEYEYWRALVDKAESIWFNKKRLPTDAEYRDALIQWDVDEKLFTWLLKHDNFMQMIRERGFYDPTDTSSLTPVQYAAAHTYMNTNDTRSLKTKLLDLGVTTGQFNAWMKAKYFKEYIAQLANELFGGSLPIAHRALLAKVAQGDIRAIKLYYDKYGFGADMQTSNEGDLRQVVMKLVEVVQTHVKDQDVLRQIARDFEESMPDGNTIRGEIERA